MDGRGDVDDNREDGRRNTKCHFHIYFMNTFCVCRGIWAFYCSNTRNTFSFSFPFQATQDCDANPKIRKFHQTTSKHHSLQQQLDCFLNDVKNVAAIWRWCHLHGSMIPYFELTKYCFVYSTFLYHIWILLIAVSGYEIAQIIQDHLSQW